VHGLSRWRAASEDICCSQFAVCRQRKTDKAILVLPLLSLTANGKQPTAYLLRAAGERGRKA